MIPMRTSSIFRSRWMALIWAAGILWFAAEVAGKPPSDENVIEGPAANEIALIVATMDLDQQP